ASLVSASQRAVTAARSSATAARNSSRSRFTSASSANTEAGCVRASCQLRARSRRRPLCGIILPPIGQVDHVGGLEGPLPQEGEQRVHLPLQLGDLGLERGDRLVAFLAPLSTVARPANVLLDQDHRGRADQAAGSRGPRAETDSLQQSPCCASKG